MILNFSSQQYEFLRNILSIENLYVFEKFHAATIGQNQLELDEDTLCLIRDWAGVKLLETGFDKTCKFTGNGKHLTEIIELLYL
jgi:hypothetical protein